MCHRTSTILFLAHSTMILIVKGSAYTFIMIDRLGYENSTFFPSLQLFIIRSVPPPIKLDRSTGNMHKSFHRS